MKTLGDEWPSFTSSKQSDYVVLDENSRIENKFRFCEMGLWGGVPDILQSTYCNLPGISNILSSVPDILKYDTLGDVTEGTVNLLGNPVKAIGGLLGNNVLGMKQIPNVSSQKPSVNNQKPSVNTQKPNLLGGLLG